jgi:restriction system protein
VPVPTYDRFIEPVLRYLVAHADGALARDVHDAAADALKLSDADRAELLPSGVQAVYKNRAGWAHDRLKRAGYSASLRRGYWKLTPEGLAFAHSNREPLSTELIEDLATRNTDVRLRPSESLDETPSANLLEPTSDKSATASPDDRLEQALGELRQSVAAELLEVLSQVSPQYFETIVLDLLHRMGYGASRADLQRVGGVGDGGIDGVISLDKLGLEKVYVQAKRWQGSVGRPDVQGFYGALAGQRANKGVFITTSSFSLQAVEFAKSVERVVLIDGARLAELMIEHEVGVTLRPVKVPKLDSDYFEG